MENHSQNIIALLGPTNTGKTHLAINKMLEFEKAEGMYIYDANKKAFMDIISGISVSNLGHRHPKVIQAAKDQMDKYTYLMVYGEYIQSPQVILAKMLAEVLPASLDATFFVNSGSEAVEGALKLAKRYTGKTEMVAFKNAYHGSTHGCLSMIGDEFFRNNFRPLLPGVSHIQYNRVFVFHMIIKLFCI